MILALVNNKGGVGKTTTAVNLAAGLALQNRRVLLIDLDSQGSASLSLGMSRDELAPSTADVLLDGTPIYAVIRKTAFEGLELLTGSMELANAEVNLSDAADRVRRLRTVLDPVRTEYGFILLDCPPSLSLLLINALVAADSFIVPVTPQYLAMEGLVNLMDAVNRLRWGTGASASLMGFLLTMVDYRTRETSHVIERIRSAYRDEVFETEIRTNIRLAQAPVFGKTIFEYDPSSSGADAYRRLVAEVLRRAPRIY